MLVTLEEIEDVKGSETHHMGTVLPGQSETKSNATRQESWPMATGDQNSDIASEAPSVISEDEGATRIISLMSRINFGE